MTKALTILSLLVAGASGLTACSKSSEQSVATDNASNAVDLGAPGNFDDIAPNATDTSAGENAANASL